MDAGESHRTQYRELGDGRHEDKEQKGQHEPLQPVSKRE
jgi:hypothetical protein